MFSETTPPTLPPGFLLIPGLLSTAVLFSPLETKEMLEDYPAEAKAMANDRWVLAGDVGPVMWSMLHAGAAGVQVEAALTPSPNGARLLAISHYVKGAMHRFVLAVDEPRTQAFLRASLLRPPLFSLGQAGGDTALLMLGELSRELVQQLLRSGGFQSGAEVLPPIRFNKGVIAAELFVAPVKEPQLQEISVSMPESLVLSYQGPLH